ncbi:Acetyltransferase (GNAT) domain-containing protein [Nakamurella panacisegetis]|uniref:Acetyltransferase (GNAT) domain-containing protein n=1 Tax=Nakamurella panacisegetis TaxID=1090615 RepID=A0A1H0SJE0_9ACTN|nr:GNAT family N-acetyltransferase [Nakamurella panacisegetis]SDP41649.1 Acetyltransferase (GNAT) domain-containing protein [Nakamurella panacisegetis]
MADALVRPAGPDDAPILARLQIGIWQQAYPDLLPAAALLADPQVQAEVWAARVSAGGAVLLAFEGTEPVGLASTDPDPDDRGQGQVELLHVLPRWSRRGHGGRLLGAAAAELRKSGATRGTWWAPETDESVQQFLLGVGWAADGGRRVLDTSERTFTEIRYSGNLDLILL